MTEGIIAVWHAEQGWGVIESAETPGGCWMHFSHLWADTRPAGARRARCDFRTAVPGETVDFRWEAADQDGYRFRATNVLPRRAGPNWRVEPE